MGHLVDLSRKDVTLTKGIFIDDYHSSHVAYKQYIQSVYHFHAVLYDGCVMDTLI